MTAKTKTIWYQQGDVIIEPAELPRDIEPIAPGERGHVLEAGSGTGHAHVVTRPDFTTVYRAGGDRYVVAKRAFTVSHEEHKSITIPPGTYRVRGVREYDHFEEEARRVID